MRRIKESILIVYETIDEKFHEQFGFRMRNATFDKIVKYLHVPKDSSSLAVTRILFGLTMLFDIPDERGGAVIDKRWGDPRTCHFPLLPFIQALPMPYMGLVYGAMWFGAVGIMLGYKYRTSSAIFAFCHWYLLLIEKSFWNNHSYLFGLVGLLLVFTDANCLWSVDAYLDPALKKDTVPYWNYFILKYQFFILYFMAGMKKGTAEWLTGYSVQNLSEHWVFDPFKLFLSVAQTDYLIVHWFAFIFDLTIAFWMMWSPTRHVAMVFCAMFHLMNSRLFSIGMFPWVCLATMPLFYPFDWPKLILQYLKNQYTWLKTELCRRINLFKFKQVCHCKANTCNIDDEINDDNEKISQKCDNQTVKDQKFPNDVFDKTKELIEEDSVKDETNKKFTDETECKEEINKKNNDVEKKEIDKDLQEMKENMVSPSKSEKIVTYLIIFHIVTQAFLPYSHFITKGYNNWTNGLYGYSWDMMVHTWDTNTVVVKVVDNDQNKEFYLNPYIYTPNDRWTRHGDMIYQYANCLKQNLLKNSKDQEWINPNVLSENISIYIDVWCSMNGRFTQRMFDYKVDLLKASWSPFKRTEYLMPILDEGLKWRTTLDGVREEVHSWSDYTDVLFLADFPGYDLEKYIPNELRNVTLTVLEGLLVYETEVTKYRNGQSYRLTTGDRIEVDTGMFHKVLNIGQSPAFYMYTFLNSTEMEKKVVQNTKQKLPIVEELLKRFRGMVRFGNLVMSSIFQLFFRMPMSLIEG